VHSARRGIAQTKDGGHGVQIDIPVGKERVSGDLESPNGPSGVVLFAHGSGSSRFSPRNRMVAEALRERGLTTLLMDLLTPEEDEEDRRTARLRFDIVLLAERLIAAVDWVVGEPRTAGLPVGCFGASTGAAAALVASARRPQAVRAVVSRGGRPDLAGEDLPSVKAPTLLIVGGEDEPVIGMNREAMGRVPGETELIVVSGATHLFEEPGALEEVARLAGDWFVRHLGGEDAGHETPSSRGSTRRATR
jgi:putative phosphoribosyl transferase